MTGLEKKIMIKNIIDEIPEANLDKALLMVQELVSKDETRKKILLPLLKNEKSLFKKLAK